MKTPFLIIGQGLAGSLLAWNLLKKRQSVLIIDNHHRQSASSVAAGLINPIIGRRFSILKNYGLLYKEALQTYQAISTSINKKIIFHYNIQRFLKTDTEKTYWKKNKDKVEYKKLVDPDFIHDEIDSFLIKKSGYCQTKELIEGLARYFTKKKILIREPFLYSKLKIEQDCIYYKNITARKIIFCEGFRVKNNPWFSYLPFQPAKGEILTVTSSCHSLPKTILHRGTWLIPLGNSLYRTGSTYSWNPLNCRPTSKGRQQILKNLNHFIRIPFKVIDHQAGVRPATVDQNPIIGLHPHYPALGIFNGFGSRGVISAPFYAKQLTNHILKKSSLNRDVDIHRFIKT